jgi:hypothetical protein
MPYVTTDKHGVRLEYRRVNNPVFPKINGSGEQDDLIDQLMYIDMQQKLMRDSEGSFVTQTNYYTPEYKERSERYRGVDMKTFFNRVLTRDDSDDNGFQSPVQIGNINNTTSENQNVQPPTQSIEPSYPPIIVPTSNRDLGNFSDTILGSVSSLFAGKRNNSLTAVPSDDELKEAYVTYNQTLDSMSIPRIGYSKFISLYEQQQKDKSST